MNSPTPLILLDTNVLVHLIRNGTVGQRMAADHALRDRPERPLISVITLGEVLALARKLGWGEEKREGIRSLLGNLVIVSLELGEIAERYGEIDHHCERVMKPARKMGQNDIWIAATASVLGARLMTTDSDFDHLATIFVDLMSIDPRTGETRAASSS